MAEQLFYKDVEIGTEITPLVKHPHDMAVSDVGQGVGGFFMRAKIVKTYK
jgi:hypothetical protein